MAGASLIHVKAEKLRVCTNISTASVKGLREAEENTKLVAKQIQTIQAFEKGKGQYHTTYRKTLVCKQNRAPDEEGEAIVTK